MIINKLVEAESGFQKSCRKMNKMLTFLSIFGHFCCTWGQPNFCHAKSIEVTLFVLCYLACILMTFFTFSLKNILSDPYVLPNGMKLGSLLCAGDSIILSRSKVGLQNCLNTLSSYCVSWMLETNPKKTKIMIFQNAKRNATLASTLAMKISKLSKLHLPRNLHFIL